MTDYFSTHGCMRLFSSFAVGLDKEGPPLDAAALAAAARALLSKKLMPQTCRLIKRTLSCCADCRAEFSVGSSLMMPSSPSQLAQFLDSTSDAFHC